MNDQKITDNQEGDGINKNNAGVAKTAIPSIAAKRLGTILNTIISAVAGFLAAYIAFTALISNQIESELTKDKVRGKIANGIAEYVIGDIEERFPPALERLNSLLTGKLDKKMDVQKKELESFSIQLTDKMKIEIENHISMLRKDINDHISSPHVLTLPIGAITALGRLAKEPSHTTENNLRKQGWWICDGSEIKEADVINGTVPLTMTEFDTAFKMLQPVWGGNPTNKARTIETPDFRGRFLRGVAENKAQDPGLEERTWWSNLPGFGGTVSWI